MSQDTLGESKWHPEAVNIRSETGLGHGKSNTYQILHAKRTKSLTKENCAAYRCSIYSTPSTKVGEWFLPSKDELDLIYKWKNKRVLVATKNNYFWSSSQHDHNLAWYQDFSNGYQFTTYKVYLNYSVRAVRAF